MKNLVSIIIPIYNVSNYMDDCIRSVCNQDYHNLEILLIDDGSTDESKEKCDVWAKKDSRIKVIHQKNGGLSSARNAGLDIATGTYIYFLDGDDTIEKHLITTGVNMMDTGVDIVFFNFYKVYPNGEKMASHHKTGNYHLISGKERARFLTEFILSNRLGWEAWDKLYRKELIENYDLRFADNNVIFAEDMYFCLCYCTHITKAVSISDILYNYIQRTDSIMSEQSMKLNVGRMNMLAKKVLEFLNQFDDCKPIVEQFPTLYFMIMDNQLTRIRNNLAISPQEYRSMIYNDLNDIQFWKKWIGEFLKNKKVLYTIYDWSIAALKISYIRFLYDGNYLFLRIRNRIINHHWELLNQIFYKNKEFLAQIKQFSKNKKCIYYLGSEEYGNLGDAKIAEAITEFANQYFSEYHFLEITCNDYSRVRLYLRRYIKRKDIIFLTGGGNFGNLYPASEKIREDIISCWKKNLKIVFPQTLDFSKDAKGNKWLQEAKTVYTKKNNVIIFAREEYSFRLIQKSFDCDSYLVPDIVLFLNEQKKVERGKRILLCFRNDIERNMSELERECIVKATLKTNYDIEYIDLQLPYDVAKNLRREKIEEKINAMRRASLVITDRLHGMVFAAITGTPCIALSNYNHKVEGTYKWISYLPYVKYAESAEDVIRWIPQMLKMNDCKYDNDNLLPFYEKLAQIIKKCSN